MYDLEVFDVINVSFGIMAMTLIILSPDVNYIIATGLFLISLISFSIIIFNPMELISDQLHLFLRIISFIIGTSVFIFSIIIKIDDYNGFWLKFNLSAFQLLLILLTFLLLNHVICMINHISKLKDKNY